MDRVPPSGHTNLMMIHALHPLNPIDTSALASTAGRQRNSRAADMPKTLQQWWNEPVTMAGIVLAYQSRLGTPMLTHEKITLEAVARAVAQVKHYEFAGWYDIPHRYSDDIYFVPDDTLMPD